MKNNTQFILSVYPIHTFLLILFTFIFVYDIIFYDVNIKEGVVPVV